MIKFLFDSSRGFVESLYNSGQSSVDFAVPVQFNSTVTFGTNTTITQSKTSVSGSISLGTQRYVMANALSASFTLTLPNASNNDSLVITIKKIDTSTNIVRVQTVLSQTIDLDSSVSIDIPMTSIDVLAHEGNWWIV